MLDVNELPIPSSKNKALLGEITNALCSSSKNKALLGEITNALCFEILENIIAFLSDDNSAILFCSEVNSNWNVVARQFAFKTVQLDRIDSSQFHDILQSNRTFAESNQFWPLIKGTKTLTINLDIGSKLLDIIQWCPNLRELALEGHQLTIRELRALPEKLKSLIIKDGIDIYDHDDPSTTRLPNLEVFDHF
jgi:hypothetical protein